MDVVEGPRGKMQLVDFKLTFATKSNKGASFSS